MPWKRPSDVPVGRVWSRFKGRERDGAPALTYQIRDMEEPYRKQCLDLMQETFIRDEPICQVLDIASDPESIQTIRNNWEEYVSQHISIACFTEENGEPKDLVGFNILLVKCKDDEEEDIRKVKGESWRKCLKTLAYSERLVDVFEYYNVDKFLTSSGLTVLPGHRGQNIGARLIEARKELCKTFGIKAGCTVFTAKTSQVLAAKCNYEVIATMPYEDMKKYGVDLTGCGTTEAKVMGIRYD
ncbi:uncharacterized protein LOC123871245 [Maniola jurtina]|uniref:uncharacterized protein LOC123871245 n=1 Tax=Maniola jurtina TaxID=191418 RepID=UPI001E68A932|nr:uncharacterized protein LOC123871245 [Maniola jurtina]XP_045770895.1 uncharacterized protein LOC123871245 [Maniola jurtina]